MSNYTRGTRLTQEQIDALNDRDIILLAWVTGYEVIGSLGELKELGYIIKNVYNVTVWPANLDAESEARRRRRGTQ